MENKKVKEEGADKGSGLPFNRRNFNNKDPMFKATTVGLETIVFSYGLPKDADTFIKRKEALYRYIGVNFKVGGEMAARAIISITDPYLKLPEYPDDTAGKVSFLKW